VAKSFAPHLLRNAHEHRPAHYRKPEAVDGTKAGDTLEIDLDAGEITNVTREKTYKAKPFPPFMLEVDRGRG